MVIPVTALLFSGCHSLSGTNPSQSSETSSQSAQAWAPVIQEELELARGKPYEEFMRTILADYQISEAELAETQSRVLSCLREVGVENFRYLEGDLGSEAYGIEGDPDGSKAREAADKCEEAQGYPAISGLHSSMKINPSRANWEDLIVTCLTRNKAVDPAYSTDDYQRELQKYITNNSDAQGNVEGDPRYAIDYIVDEEKGVQILSHCQEDPSFNSN
ncbi:MAG: hypothetical protein Q4C87_09465 [Actinomycetaceae bacterium]|nr:hypothetical protein [Actinomycetaceae bacterium]